jgi:hypothetical protein
VHVLAAAPAGAQQEIIYRLPINRVFEDLTLRLADIDQDGRDEIIVIESDVLRGASVVVLGLEDAPNGKTLKEKARSPPACSALPGYPTHQARPAFCWPTIPGGA